MVGIGRQCNVTVDLLKYSLNEELWNGVILHSVFDKYVIFLLEKTTSYTRKQMQRSLRNYKRICT